MWIKHPFFKYSTGIALVLLILSLLGRIEFVMYPLLNFLSILFFPIIFAGFLYYILKPLVNLLTKTKYIPRTLAIIFVFLIFVGGFTWIGFAAGGTIESQISSFFYWNFNSGSSLFCS